MSLPQPALNLIGCRSSSQWRLWKRWADV